MDPITFVVQQRMSKSGAQIAAEIANLDNWPQFTGYGLLPGIESAEYETRTASMVGSRIRVQNSDGSQHVEEILFWDPAEGITMRLGNFSPPLQRLADSFIERWTFEEDATGTDVTRSFEMYPASTAAWPFLWVISQFFRRAIAHHLSTIAASP